MKIVLVTNDMGPSRGLALVQQELEARRHEVIVFFGKGKPFPPETITAIQNAVPAADRVLVGISAFVEKTKEEISAAIAAIDSGVPFGFFCCNYGEFRRSWLKEGLLAQASFLFVVDESEAAVARALAPNTTVVPSGNPDWATYFTAATDRHEMRTQLGILPNEKMVLCTGTKISGINLLMWKALSAMSERLGNDVKIILSRHIGEQNPPEEEYQSLLRPGMQFSTLSPSHLLCGADLAITVTSLSGIEAACKRIPTIDFICPAAEEEWFRLSGSHTWPPAEQGASVVTEGAASLEIAVRKLLYTHGTAMLDAQKKLYPFDGFSRSAKEIADIIIA